MVLKQVSQESHVGIQPFRPEEESAIYRGQLHTAAQLQGTEKSIYKGNPVLLVKNELLYKKLHQN